MVERTVIRTLVYERSLGDLPKNTNIKDFENEIAKDPLYWPVIRGTGGIRKARFSLGSKGKRGGGRLCYIYIAVHEEIYLLKAYAKNVQEDISPEEKKRLSKLAELLKKGDR